jgi:hypothetical protein
LCSDKLYLLDTTNLDDGGNALNWTADPENVEECRLDLSDQEEVSRWGLTGCGSAGFEWVGFLEASICLIVLLGGANPSLATEQFEFKEVSSSL